MSLAVLLLTAVAAARRVVRLMDLRESDQLPGRVLATGTLAVAWSLVCAQLPAYLAELTDVPLVRMPLIAAVSLAGFVLLRLLTAGLNMARPAIAPVRRVPAGIAWGCLLPVVVLHGFLIIDGLLRPPYGSDGLFYHLPLMVRWLRAGRLAMVPEVRFFNYPANCELWQMLFASPRIEPLIELSLVPIGLLLAAAVLAIARELGATWRAAVVVALFALVCPMIALQMYSSFVDMFGAAFIVAALYWMMRLCRGGHTTGQRWGLVLLTGLSLGLAVGAKLTFLPWAGLIVTGALISLSRGENKLRPRFLPKAVLVLLLGGLATGGFWYLRNLYHTGWAFYPLKIEIAGRVIGTGWTLDKVSPAKQEDDRGLACLAYPWFEWKRAGYPYAPDNGLGLPLAAFAVPGLAYLALRKRRQRPGDVWVAAWVWVFTVSGLVMFVTIFRPAARYSLPGWAVMLAACAPLLDVMLRARPRAALALVSLTITVSAGMVALEPAGVFAGRLRDGDLNRSHAYQIPRLFDGLPEGSVVLNLGPGEMSYPLLGAGWRNRVIEPYTAWHQGFRRPYSRARLDERGVDIVYTRGDLPGVFTADVSYDVLYDDSAAADRPSGTPVTRVYRIVREQTASEQPLRIQQDAHRPVVHAGHVHVGAEHAPRDGQPHR